MLRIGICDDIYDARLVLRAALERVLEKRRVQGQFREFSSGEGLLRWLESHAGELDLVFLDMEMGELDGMETARRLRAADAGLQLVFVTGYAEHVFDGYSVGALGYLLKPPKAEQLEEVLDRAQAALVRDLDRAYICRSGDTHYRIPIANILYFVSDRRQVACVTAGREYTFYGKLDTVAAEVGADFVRIHQRYLVRTGDDAIVVHITQHPAQQRRHHDRNQHRCVNVARGQNSNDEEAEDTQKYAVRSQITDAHQRFRVSDNHTCVFQPHHANEQTDTAGNTHTQTHRNVGYHPVANAENRQ